MPGGSQAAEGITGFHSLVEIFPDGHLDVTETIRVRAEGRDIRRGIYRDFPTAYHGSWGRRVRVPFRVVEALRDGAAEAWRTEGITNGVRVYLGRENVFLEPGFYTYTLKYRTDRQLGFFDGFDELYWNVTGNGWEFVIEKAEAEIRLPQGASALNLTAYTGRTGEKGRDWTSSGPGRNTVHFATTRPLKPQEGLTVAVSWPKGFVREPTPAERRKNTLADNGAAAAALAGLAVLFLYYSAAWIVVGRDPPRGAVVTLYEPPEEYSPAAMHFIMNMGYGDRAFAATVVDLAVKGRLTIEKKNGVYTLRQASGDDENLTAAQRRVARALFAGGTSLTLRTGSHRRVRRATDALKKALRKDFGRLHFRTNRKYLLPGGVITLLTVIAMAAFSGAGPEALFFTVWISFWTVGCWVLLSAVIRAWRDVRAGSGIVVVARVFGALFLTAFSLPFLGAEIGASVMYARAVSIPAGAGLIAAILVSLLFSLLLKAPTILGRRVMDRIEGFRRYLEAAEKDRLERMRSPELTPQLFEKYLPYAIALDVENSWGGKFAAAAAAAGIDSEWRPAWYDGPGDRSGLDGGRFASSLASSLSSAVSSSSTPPGSSSGSGGGGSSGGGGGGGGGGGW
jgi:uncharacterized membrane protein YgcG